MVSYCPYLKKVEFTTYCRDKCDIYYECKIDDIQYPLDKYLVLSKNGDMVRSDDKKYNKIKNNFLYKSEEIIDEIFMLTKNESPDDEYVEAERNLLEMAYIIAKHSFENTLDLFCLFHVCLKIINTELEYPESDYDCTPLNFMVENVAKTDHEVEIYYKNYIRISGNYNNAVAKRLKKRIISIIKIRGEIDVYPYKDDINIEEEPQNKRITKCEEYDKCSITKTMTGYRFVPEKHANIKQEEICIG